jgi:hypothetical protein
MVDFYGYIFYYKSSYCIFYIHNWSHLEIIIFLLNLYATYLGSRSNQINIGVSVFS